MYTVLIHTVLCFTLICAASIQDYERDRNKILEEETNFALGGLIQLSEDEIKVNNILMNFKEYEHNSSFHHPDNYNFSKHYFTYQDRIKESKLYQIIRIMPKGAVLHLHETFSLDADSLLNLTYEDHLYVCYTSDDVRFMFAELTPDRPCDVQWTLLSELRRASGNVTAFDEQLKNHLSLVCNDEYYDCPTELDKVWKKFDKTHLVTKSLITYRPVREKFLYKCLERLYDDNVMYVEIRTGLHELYELNGEKHDALYTIRLHRDVMNRFIADHPDFIGMKLILTKTRASPLKIIKNTLDKAILMKQEYPDMIAGFDLVGQEDKGKSLHELVPLLLERKGEIDFYFHAGETNWFGTASDENLIDAILLGTKRIGHGYALTKHPVLVNKIKQKDIAVEVNVISNAVLALTRDLREHPLADFLSENVPEVLSSDDPGVWGADPLSHDFYVSFMAVANRKADLRLLKKLALNSIKYSSLDNERKTALEKVFDKRWKDFLNVMLDNKDEGVDLQTLNIDIEITKADKKK